MKSLSIFILFQLVGPVWAEEPVTSPPAELSACTKVQAACENAGFVYDLLNPKNVVNNCFQPLLMEQEVPGVKIDSEIIKSCNEELQNRMNLLRQKQPK